MTRKQIIPAALGFLLTLAALACDDKPEPGTTGDSTGAAETGASEGSTGDTAPTGSASQGSSSDATDSHQPVTGDQCLGAECDTSIGLYCAAGLACTVDSMPGICLARCSFQPDDCGGKPDRCIIIPGALVPLCNDAPPPNCGEGAAPQ